MRFLFFRSSARCLLFRVRTGFLFVHARIAFLAFGRVLWLFFCGCARGLVLFLGVVGT